MVERRTSFVETSAMKVILAGGSGLIGRELTRELVEAGYEIAILSRSPQHLHDLPRGATAVRWDGRSAGALVPRLEGVTAVVNLAGESIGAGRWTEARKRRLRESRIRSAEAIALALGRVDRRPSVLLQASAVGLYGPSADEEIDESRPAGKDFLAGVCRDWEAATEVVENFGVRRVLLRTGVVLATSGGALPRILLPFKLFAGGRVGTGRQWFPWIHLADEVRAVRFLLEATTLSGAFNLTAPNPVTNGELAKRVGRILKRPSLVPAPGFVLRAIMGEMATLVLDGQRAVPRRLLNAGFEFEYQDLEPALRDLLGQDRS
jgi:uncharacterized protein (TIGR01777 family)